MKEINVIIITKSAMDKHGIKGACTAAYDLDSGQIVRLVSTVQGGPIPYFFSDKYDKLDLVKVKVIKPCPIVPQTENLLVDLKSFRILGQKYTIQDIYQRYLKNCPSDSFLNEHNYRLDSVDGYQHSLEIVYVTDFTLDKGDYGTPKAHFRIGNRQYQYFSVTDFDYDIRKSEEKSKCFGNGWIVASIPTEPYEREGRKLGYFIFIAAFYPEKD